MVFPTNPFGDDFAGRPQPDRSGFGFASAEQHRTMHRARRQARRQLREHKHNPAPGSTFGFGPGPHAGRRGRSRGHHGHRGRRGDVRAAILVLLAEQPMHGYQMIQQIAERSQELWRPSPGSVYPTLQLLVDEGLVVAQESDGTKRLFELTEAGRATAEKIATPPWQEIADGVDPGQVNLRTAIDRLFGAVAQAADAATPQQQERIVDIVNTARREVYTILGEAE